MQTLLCRKTASFTEMRNPAKVLREAKGEPVAIVNRDKCVGYFVPLEALTNITTDHKRQLGLLTNIIRVPEDFDESHAEIEQLFYGSEK